jgi:hypothetical protein
MSSNVIAVPSIKLFTNAAELVYAEFPPEEGTTSLLEMS